MSINLASKTGINNSRRVIPVAAVSAPVTYTRPADWVALPTLTTSTPKFAGLWAIFDNTYNNVSITCSAAGGFTVDWGDGTSPVNYTTGNTATYNYVYATSSNLSTRGYKQAVITVTPQTTNGAITALTLNTKPAAFTNSAQCQWLDLSIAGGSTLTSFPLSFGGTYVNNLTEQVTIQQSGGLNFNATFNSMTVLQNVVMPSTNNAALTGLAPQFGNCYNLRNAPTMSLTGYTSFNSMFNACRNLVYIPPSTLTNLGTASTWTNLASMFAGCLSLTNIPPITFVGIGASGQALDNMFSGCTSLIIAPFFNTINAGTISGMFNLCRSLTTVPLYNTTNVTTMNSMFFGCVSLTNVPLFNTINVTDMGSMFSGCSSLITIPKFNTSNVTAASVMFNGCSSLTTIPVIDTSKVISMTQFFNGATSLLSIPLLNTSNVTTFTQFAANCTSLNSVANIDLIKATTMTNMFVNDNSLLSVPTFNTANVTDMTTTFSGCGSLTTIPAFNTSNVITLTSTFQGCNNLTTIANLDTSKVTGIGTLFSGTTGLVSIPALNLSNCTTIGGTAFTPGALKRSQVTGVKITHTYATQELGNTELTEVFSNLGSNTTTPTITITGNPGADTPVLKTGISYAGGNTLTISIANTVGIINGQVVYGPLTVSGFTVTIDATTDVLTLNNHQLPAGTRITFNSITSTTGISTYTYYYIINPTTNTFQISTTVGGSAINMTTNGSASMTRPLYVTSVTTNTSITTSSQITMSGAAGPGNLSFRMLDIYYATQKNWTITG